jgi:hypothetical protein
MHLSALPFIFICRGMYICMHARISVPAWEWVRRKEGDQEVNELINTQVSLVINLCVAT